MNEINKKKKIFLLADDIRFSSGVATMAREIVFGTSHKYDWCCIAGLMKHPEEGKRIDMSKATQEKTGVTDAYCMLYPTSGYGNPDIVRQIIDLEKPDAICAFTDPRFFIWLFQMENEIRQKMPICYYNLWDSTPYPLYNRSFYMSCDTLMAISKQSENINKSVLGKDYYLTISDFK